MNSFLNNTGKFETLLQGISSSRIFRKSNKAVVARMNVTGDNVLRVKLYDGGTLRNVKAIITDTKDQKQSIEVQLTDDGRQGDRSPGDNVFSYKIPEQEFGFFQISIEAEDTFGNKQSYEPGKMFVLH